MSSALDSDKTRYLVVDKNRILTAPPQSEVAVVDSMSRSAAEAYARRMARYREADPGEVAAATEEVGAAQRDLRLTELLGLPDLDNYDPEILWKERRWNPRLEIPLGTLYRDGIPTGTPYIVDLGTGNFEGGKGPHGICQGQSGSGKSIALENFVLSTCAWHPPDKVNFMIIDFKGEASFLGYHTLPHVQGIVNDTGDPEILDRLAATLLGDIDRRKRFLARKQIETDLGLPDVGKYLQFREMPEYRNALPPLPILIVLIDEASIFYDQYKNEFTEVFTYIVKQGRSVGVWLLLASQEMGFLKAQPKLFVEMNYTSSLVVKDPTLSRAIIGEEDAHDDLVSKRVKNYVKGGHIFYKFPGQGVVHLRAANNLLEYKKGGAAKPSAGPEAAQQMTTFTLANQWEPQTLDNLTGVVDHDTPTNRTDGALRLENSEISVLLKKLSVPVDIELHNMWTPPLRKTVTLHQLGAFNGLQPATVMGDLNIPLGIIDHPMDHKQSLLSVDFATNNGNVIIAGTGKSGRTTALTTMIVTSAIRWPSRLLSWFIIDQGQKLAILRNLPNVSGYTSRGNPAMRERIFAETRRIFDLRKRLFEAHALTSPADYLKWRETNPQPADPYGYLFVGLDGWLALQQELKNEAASSFDGQGWVAVLGALIEGGKSYGIHFAITTDNSALDLPYVAQKSMSPVYLRGAEQMTDAGNDAKQILKKYPLNQPGLTVSAATLNGVGKHEVLRARVAVPVQQDIPEPSVDEIKTMTPVDYTEDIAALCDGITKACPPEQAIPRLRPLPSEVPFAEMWTQWRQSQDKKPPLPGRPQRNIEIPIGLNSVDMTIAGLPWSPDPLQVSPHTLILGRPGDPAEQPHYAPSPQPS